VKIGPVVGEIFGEIADFCRLIQKGAFVTLVISRVTGLIFIIFTQNVAIAMNIFESEWRYCKPFSNATLLNERIYPNFAIKLVAMATSFEESEKEVWIVHIHANTYCLVKRVKIGPVDPEIIVSNLKNKEINASKIYSPVGKFVERAK